MTITAAHVSRGRRIRLGMVGGAVMPLLVLCIA